MTANEGYFSWRAAVDQRLNEIYCVTLEDIGLDEEYLDRLWRSNETPADFVAWFGNKHDLDRRPWSTRTIRR
jgi:esterase/lipase superfamily enzyme